MISFPVDRVEVKPFGETGAFYSVSLKRGNSPLKRFQLENDILSASQVLQEFREEVKKSIKGITGWCHDDIFLRLGEVILLDLVLGLQCVCDTDKSRDDEQNVFPLLPLSGWKMQRKKARCPAVTLTTETPFNISMDVVLSLKVKSSWPGLTKEGFPIQTWLGAKVKRDCKRQPYYLVPKYEGSGSAQEEGIFARGEFVFWKHTHITCHVACSFST